MLGHPGYAVRPLYQLYSSYKSNFTLDVRTVEEADWLVTVDLDYVDVRAANRQPRLQEESHAAE